MCSLLASSQRQGLNRCAAKWPPHRDRVPPGVQLVHVFSFSPRTVSHQVVSRHVTSVLLVLAPSTLRLASGQSQGPNGCRCVVTMLTSPEKYEVTIQISSVRDLLTEKGRSGRAAHVSPCCWPAHGLQPVVLTIATLDLIKLLQMTALDQLAAVALESELQLQQEEAQARDAQAQAQARDAQAQAQAQADEPASLGGRGVAVDAGGVAGTATGLEPALGSDTGQVRCSKP